MVMDYVKNVSSQINPKCSCFHVPLKQLYIGMASTATLSEMEVGRTPHQEFEKFCTDCRKFLIESIEQIQKRFDLGAEILTIVQCISPANAASLTPPSLQPNNQYVRNYHTWMNVLTRASWIGNGKTSAEQTDVRICRQDESKRNWPTGQGNKMQISRKICLTSFETYSPYF